MKSQVSTEIDVQSEEQDEWLPVTVTGSRAGSPPVLEFYTVMTLRNGATKHGQSVALIEDMALLQRLSAEMALGTKFRINLWTDWEAEGIPTFLIDFCRY